MTAINDGPRGPRSKGRVSRRAPAKSGSHGSKRANKANAPSARVTLSSDVRLVDTVKGSLNDVPAVNAARVAELRQAVKDGSYQPDLEGVADGLLKEALLGSGHRVH